MADMCNCIIGLLDLSDAPRIAHKEGLKAKLVTLDDLKQHISDRSEINNQFFMVCPGAKASGLYQVKEWTVAQYADARCNTNLRRFNYCPKCGKKIEWKSIRRCGND